MHDTDIAIVGAGLVGLPLAMALSARGWSVSLLDQQPAADNPTPSMGSDLDDAHCIALSAGSVAWLRAEGFWEALAPQASPIDVIKVSQQHSFGVTRLEAESFGVEALGQVIAAADAVAVYQQALASSAVHTLYGYQAEAVELAGYGPGGRIVVRAADPALPAVSARLLIAVDGINSGIRKASGLATRRHEYDQVAIIGNVVLGQAHENVAHERFTPEGPLAFLPRQGQVANVVHCVSAEAARGLQSLDDAAYRQVLQQKFGYRFGALGALGKRLQFPLTRIEIERQMCVRTLFLGNAARLLHPVAGQGYNLALRDASGFIAMLDDHPLDDPGSAENLGRFLALRKPDQQATVRLSDSLARGFLGQAALPRHARSLGLFGLDKVPPLRRQFGRRAMGLEPQQRPGL